jgi:putative inorganic carbon (hco3(-)) transporter
MRSFALLTLFLIYLPPVFVQPFCGILLWTWFSIMNPHRLAWGFGASVPYALIIALSTLTAWFVSREPKTPPASAITIGLIGMLITICISTFFALSPGPAFEKLDTVIKTLIMCVLSLALLTNKVRIHAYIWVLVLSLGYFGIKGGTFALLTGGNYLVFGPENTYIADNNHLATALIMAVPLMHFLQLQSRNWWVRMGLAGMQILSLFAAVASYSRGALLAMLAMGAVFWWRSPKRLGLSIAIAAIACIVLVAAPARWFERMNTISEYQDDDSAMGRITIWKAGLNIVASHPIFGGGFRVTHAQDIVDKYAPGTKARAVHNSHLEILIENGIVGFFFHLVLVFGTWIYGSRVRRMTQDRPDMVWARDLASMIQTSLAGYVVGGALLSLGYYDGWFNIAVAMGALHALVVRQTMQQNSPAVDLRATPSNAIAPSWR